MTIDSFMGIIKRYGCLHGLSADEQLNLRKELELAMSASIDEALKRSVSNKLLEEAQKYYEASRSDRCNHFDRDAFRSEGSKLTLLSIRTIKSETGILSKLLDFLTTIWQ